MSGALIALLSGFCPGGDEESSPAEPKPGEAVALTCRGVPAVGYHCFVPETEADAARLPLLVAMAPGRTDAKRVFKSWAKTLSREGWIVALILLRGEADTVVEERPPGAMVRAVVTDVRARIPAAHPERAYGLLRAVDFPVPDPAFWDPELFAGLFCVGPARPPATLSVPSHFAIYLAVGAADPSAVDLTVVRSRLEAAGVSLTVQPFRGGNALPARRLLARGLQWLTQTWLMRRDDGTPEGRAERLAAARKAAGDIEKHLKRNERADAYEQAVAFEATFRETADPALAEIVERMRARIAELERDPSVAGLKDYVPVAPSALVDAFVRFCEANAELPKARRTAALGVARAASGADAVPADVLTEALAAAYPTFAAALKAYDEGDADVAAAELEPLTAAADPYLAAHATYFRGRTFLAREDYERALAAFSRVAGIWRDRTLYLGETLFLVGVCQAELLQRAAAQRAFDDFLKHFPGAAERLRVGAQHRLVEMRNTEEGSLTDIEDRMDDSRRRLALARSGRATQERQKEIVAMLDELIELAEQAEGGGGGGGGGGQGQGQGQGGGQSGGNASGNSSGAPAAASSLPGGEARVGPLGEIRRADSSEKWGEAREREREQVMNVLKSRFPEQYRELIEQYYRGLQAEE